MQKFLSRLLTFVFIVNTLLSNFSLSAVFAAADINFVWDVSNTLDDALNIKSKGSAYDETFLWWDFGVDKDGKTFDSGIYTLEYNLENHKKIIFTIEKKTSNTASVVYKVVDTQTGNQIPMNSAAFEVYSRNTGGFISNPNSNTYPQISNDYGIVYEYDYNGDGTDEAATEPRFDIIKDAGFNFKFDNRNIKFKWATGDNNDIIYFVTDGVTQGNIHDFNLTADIYGNSANPDLTEKLSVFTGINPNTFTVDSYANGGLKEIDHTDRSSAVKNPGYEPGMVLQFDMPKVWDSALNEFVYTNSSDKTTLTLDLGNTNSNRKMQLIIYDIYANPVDNADNYSFAHSGAEGLKIERIDSDGDGIDDKISVDFSNLTAGVIYNPVELSLNKTYADGTTLISDSTSIEHGRVYTVPEFYIEPKGTKEYYMVIKPYSGYSGYYTVYASSSPQISNKDQWVVYQDKTSGTSDIQIPVVLDASVPTIQYYKVEFVFTPPDNTPGNSQNPIQSQTLKYKPSEDDVAIATPSDFSIDSKVIVQSDEDSSKQNLLVSFSWEIGYKDILSTLIDKNGGSLDVTYTLQKGKKPQNDMSEFSNIVIHLTKDADGNILGEFSDKEGLIVITDELGNEKSKLTYKDVLVGSQTQQNVIANVTLKVPIVSNDENRDDSAIFSYPNIYFLNVKGSYTINGVLSKIEPSLTKDMSLDGPVDMDVPQPQNVKVVYVADDITKFEVNWDTMDYGRSTSPLYDYNQTYLNAMGYSLDNDSVKFNAYVSQKKDVLDTLIKYDADRDSAPNSIKDLIQTYDHNNQKGSVEINASSASTDKNMTIRDALRNGGIVKIENILQDYNADYQNFILNGLDKNQEYYIIVETKIEAKKISDSSVLLEDNSSYSEMVTTTTYKDPEKPDDSEKVPPSPLNFIAEDIDLNSAKLAWDRVKETASSDSNSVLEYQFIRVKGEQLPSEIINSRETYSKTWENVGGINDKKGWRTDGAKIFSYTGTDFSPTEDDGTNFEYNVTDQTVNRLTDKTLGPNQLYFYYIRTVRVSDSKDQSYSVWVPLSVTTTPVEAPKNLKVEPLEKHDKMDEIVISFDLPELNLEQLGTDYYVQYSIKEDDGPWQDPVTINSEKLKEKGTVNADKTLHFLYTLTNLKSGTYYSIKVRLYDTKLKEYSMYSNIARGRTDQDQGDYDDNKDKSDWLDHYKDLLSDMLKDPYWYSKNGIGSTEAIYRPSAFGSVIASEASSTIELTPGKGGSNRVYYIPSSAVDQAFDANKGFKISWQGMDVIFSPQSIDAGMNSAILDIKERMREKSVDDYFVRITVKFNESTYTVDGNNSLSPSAEVIVEAVGTKVDLDKWENEMILKIQELIEDEDKLEDVIDDIADGVYDEDSPEAMVDMLKDHIDDFAEDLYEFMEDELDDILKREFTSVELNGSIIIAYPIDSATSASGYRQVGSAWDAISLSDYNGKKAIYTNLIGTYIFAGRKVTLPGIGNVPNGTVITNIVTKYGLDDYLGKDSAFNLNAPMTKNMALGCAARLAGAGNTADPAAFLASKGINVNSRNSQGNISSQEAVYLVMAVYQVRTGTNVESVRITNYTLTSNIQGLQPAFKKSIQAAYQLGVYTNPNMVPNGTITVNEFLQMLAALSSKTSL